MLTETEVRNGMRSAVAKSFRAVAEKLRVKYRDDRLTGAEMAEVLEKTARDFEEKQACAETLVVADNIDRRETIEAAYNDLLNHHLYVLAVAYDGLLNHHLHDDDERDMITMRVGQCLSKKARDLVAFGSESDQPHLTETALKSHD